MEQNDPLPLLCPGTRKTIQEVLSKKTGFIDKALIVVGHVHYSCGKKRNDRNGQTFDWRCQENHYNVRYNGRIRKKITAVRLSL